MVRSLVALIFFAPLLLKAQSQYAEQLRAGNSAYTDSNYTQAEEAYRKSAADDPSSAKAAFNLGDALYRQERYEEAIEAFEKSYGKQSDPQQQSKSLQNLGNAHYQMKNYPEAAKAYGESLKLDPENEEARYNMAQALRRIQEPPPQQEQQEGEKQEKEEQEENKQEQAQPQPQEEENESSEEQEQQAGEEEMPQADPDENQEQEGGKIDKEEALRLLEALEKQEEELQKKLMRENAPKAEIKSEKDW
jgi:Ca-activated chloride channel family protein